MRIGCLVAILLHAWFWPVAAQTACQGCSIDLRETAWLPDVGTTSKIVRLPDSTLVLAHQYNPYQLEHHAKTGGLLHTIGGRGDGPGEYGRIVDLKLDSTGRLRVFDSSGRETILSVDGSVVATRRTPSGILPAGVALLAKGDLAFNRVDRSQEYFGYWAFLTDSLGRIKVPLGQRARDVPPWLGIDPVMVRHLVPDGESVWLIHNLEYRLEAWSLDGVLERSAERIQPWFPRFDTSDWYRRIGTRTEVATDNMAPLPSVAGARIDGVGRLWTVVNIVQPGWAEAFETGRLSDAFASVVEVWDPVNLNVMASRHLPHYSGGFSESGELITITELPSALGIRLWRPTLRTPKPGG